MYKDEKMFRKRIIFLWHVCAAFLYLLEGLLKSKARAWLDVLSYDPKEPKLRISL
jgi:hypothetical protein